MRHYEIVFLEHVIVTGVVDRVAADTKVGHDEVRVTAFRPLASFAGFVG